MSARLADVIERLMATSPDDRYPSAEAAGDALLACLEEARIDVSDPAWSLSSWLDDADAWERRLEDHLTVVLLEEGRRCLSQGDHLAALRLFNRLLSMDGDNEEVLTLVQGLHGDPSPVHSGRTYLLAAVGLLAFLLGGGALVWVGQRSPEPEPIPPPEPMATAAPSPSPEPAPEPAPPPAPEPGPEGSPTPDLASTPDSEPAVAPAPAPAPAIAPSPRPARPLARKVPAQPEPAPERPVELPGRLVVRTGEIAAQVWLDGRKIGDTRQVHELPAGAHTLELRGLYVEPHTETVVVSPGEELVVSVKLKPKPARIYFDASWSDPCVVSLDGSPAGTIAQLERVLAIESPLDPHEVTVACDDGPPRSQRYAAVPGETTFPGR
jgi:hypothetical protein